MITKGKSTTGRALAAHLLKKENDRVEVWDIRGAALQDLREAVDDWREFSKGTNCAKPIYHAQLNPDRDLSREEWEKAIAIFEKELGLEGYPRAAVLHEKEGREHLHLVYSRFNHDLEAEHLRAWSDSWNYPKHERASREIERVLGLERVQGVHVEKDGKPRADRTPTHDAMQQGDRLKIDPRTVKAEVSELYKAADNGRAFVEGLENAGYTLAQGDKRGFVILDQAGGVHSLSRAANVKAAELRETLKDYPLRELPTVQAVRESGRFSAQRPELENELAAPRHHFAQTLGDSAQVTRATTADEYLASLKARREYSGQQAPERESAPRIDDSAEAFQKHQESAKLDRNAERIEAQRNQAPDLGRTTTASFTPVASVATKAAEKVANIAAELLDILGPAPRPITWKESRANEAAQQEYQAQQKAERERNYALDKIIHDRNTGKNLNPENMRDELRKLGRDDLEMIKARGDDGIKHLIDERERERQRERERNRGRERER